MEEWPHEGFDQELAIQEVITSLTESDEHPVPTVVTKAIRQRIEGAREEERLRESTGKVKRLLESHREHSRSLRLFLRKADRLRRRQMQQIRVAFSDGRKRGHAIAELDEIYAEYILKAIGIEARIEG